MRSVPGWGQEEGTHQPLWKSGPSLSPRPWRPWWPLHQGQGRRGMNPTFLLEPR